MNKLYRVQREKGNVDLLLSETSLKSFANIIADNYVYESFGEQHTHDLDAQGAIECLESSYFDEDGYTITIV